VQLNKQTVDMFWLWILGLTDQLIHSKISTFEYDEALQACQKEFFSIANQMGNDENDVIFNNNDENGEEENKNKKFDSKGLFYKDIELDTSNIKVGDIQPQQEFRFMFLRYWTLYK
jgi:hypothetical protein